MTTEQRRLEHWQLSLPVGTPVWAVRHDGEIIGTSLQREVVVARTRTAGFSVATAAFKTPELARNLDLFRVAKSEIVMEYRGDDGYNFYYRASARKNTTPCYCGGEGVDDIVCGKPVHGRCGSPKCKYRSKR